MKKLFFLLLLLPFLVSAQKTTPGNYTYIAQKYEWDAGVFKGLSMPAGPGPAAFIAGQVQRAGAVYYDTVGADAGDYIYNGTAWVLQGSPASLVLPDQLIQPGYVIYSGTGLKFYITPSIARIDGIIYGTDQDSVTLSAADPDDPRKDVIYLATTGVEVLTGTPAGPAAEPQLEAGQIKLTVVDVPALATTPGITTTIVYDENTESVVTNTGTTTDGDNTTNVFRLTKSLQFGPMTNGDIIWFDPALPTLAWDINGKDFSLFIKLGSVLSTGYNLYVQFFNGATAVSPEVAMGINKSFLEYQPVKIPFSSFGNVTNTNITRIRIRMQGSGTLAVSYMDYVHFVTGLTQPGPAGGVNSVTLQGPTGWEFNGPTTGDVIQTIVPGGTPTQMLGGDGVVKTDSSVHSVDLIDSYTKNNDGATINTATKSIGFHLVNSTYNGLMSAYQYRQLDTLMNQTLENASTGDTLVYAIDAFRTAIKSIVAGSNITITPTDTTLVISSTGGGGGGGGITEVVADYGLQNINDSTLAVDTFVIATKDRVLEVADSLGAAKVDKSQLSSAFMIQNDSLKINGVVYIKDFGAAGDGVTNDTAAFRAAFATGKKVIITPGTYVMSGSGSVNEILTAMATSQTIEGVHRDSCIIQINSNSRGIAMQPFGTIRNLTFKGTKSKFISNDYQTGIVISTNDTAVVIENCVFKNLGGSTNYLGGGIYVSSIVGSNTMGGSIRNNIFNDNYIGLTIHERGEYFEVTGNKFISNNTGLVNEAGNTIIGQNNFQFNEEGLYLRAGTNDGHGLVVGNNINHNTVNLHVEGITRGMTFTGNHFYQGNINITNSIGVMFNGCDFVAGIITLTNSTKLLRQGCRVPLDGTANNMTLTVVSGETFLDANNLDF